MEAKCHCEWSSIVPTSCSCKEKRSTCQRSSDNNSSAFYWAQFSQSDEKTVPPLKKSVGKSNEGFIFKEMTSWKYPASACIAPCISTRRLNRTYSEQRMRCLLTTTIAFCLGISVGALLPFVFPPVELLHSLNTPNLKSESTSANLQVAQPQKLILRYESDNSDVNQVNFTNTLESLPIETEASSLLSPSLYKSVTFVDSSIDNSLSSSSTKESTSPEVKSYMPVVDGIYWSEWVESVLPRGFSDNDVENWRNLASSSKVTRVENGCGRMQNRLITYENGNKACCRYRQNFDQIQGEIFSFYLSQLLDIKNLAPSTLDVINSKSTKWGDVQNEVQSAEWVDDKPVVLTKFVNNLNQAFIPSLLRPSNRRVHPPDIPTFSQRQFQEASLSHLNFSDNFALTEIKELAQWSDLIVFDYLTANLDRMVNNLYNLQWNPSMMEAPAHNLAKDPNGLLIFLDNESGLLHGYRLLDKYEHYHRLMLDSLCVFRKSTAEAIEKLQKYGSIQPLFKSMLSQFASSQLLPMIPDKSIKVLNQRIDTVYRQIQKCQSLYINRTNKV